VGQSCFATIGGGEACLRLKAMLITKRAIGVCAVSSCFLVSVCVAAAQVSVQLPRHDPILNRPFPLKITVAWQGNADEYLFLPVELPAKDEVTIVSASMTSSKVGETNSVEYFVNLRVSKTGACELGTVTIPYRPRGSEEKLALQSDSVKFNVRANPLPMQILMGTIALAAAVALAMLARNVTRTRRNAVIVNQ